MTMMLSSLTLAEIREVNPGCYVEEFDAGLIDGVMCLDVLVWATEADSVNDDGYNAIARLLIRA